MQLTQWKLYIIQVEEILYARKGDYRFFFFFPKGNLIKIAANSHYDKG